MSEDLSNHKPDEVQPPPVDNPAPESTPPPPPQENTSDSNASQQNQDSPPPPPPDGRILPSRPPSTARGIFSWILIIALIVTTLYTILGSSGSSSTIESDAEFRSLVESKALSSCKIVYESSGSSYIEGIRTIQAPTQESSPSPHGIFPRDSQKASQESFVFFISPNSENMENYLRSKDLDFQVVYKSSRFADTLLQIIPFFLISLLFLFIFFRQIKNREGAAMSFGKSRARRLDLSRDPKRRITFANVAGVEEAKQDVLEIVEFLKAPQRFAKLGGRIPRGILLVGPPGTGKTLLAKAIAGEAGVPFFSISGSDFMEMFVGVGASRVRDMFENAKKNSPCIIFIDEIDAVGRSRFSGIGGGHDEREQTLNALLVEMDGFDSTDGVIVIAATNRPDVLDKALLRPGRFDRQIIVNLPTVEGRYKILKVHAKKIKMAEDTTLYKIARGTPGFSGADLANLLNEAALHAAALHKDAVDDDDLEIARDKVMFGRERPGIMKDLTEKRLTAFHEAGHAVVAALVKNGDPLHKITIIPRGMALGATMFLPKKDRVSFTRSKMSAMLATSMGGRVAEEIFLDDISSGAQQDLHQATDLAHRMVCDWGMSPTLGPRTFGNREETLFLGREVSRQQDYSEATAQKIDVEVSALIQEAYQKAHEILESKRNEVNKLVEVLLDKETVNGDDAMDIIQFGRIRPLEERFPNGIPVDAEAAAIDAELASLDTPPSTDSSSEK